MDFPNKLLPPLTISTISRFSPAPSISGALTSPTQGNTPFPVANQAIFCPVFIPVPFPVQRVWWATGSAGSANIDFGIYTLDGAAIYTAGSTAAAAGSTVQYVTPANPFMLHPGKYYFAIACSAVGNSNYGWTGVGISDGRMAGLLQQASAFPLPAQATFAQWASAVLPLCGIIRK